MEDNKVKLGVLWSKVTREGGRKYLSGAIRGDGLEKAIELMRKGGRLLVLSNTKRPGKQDPDCELFVVPQAAEAQPAPRKSPPQRR